MALDIRARPPYVVTPNTFSVAPSGSVTFNITTLTFGTGTLYWTIGGTITAGEFSDSANSGSVSITSNSGSVSKTLTSGVDAKTIIFQLRTGSTSGTIVATAAQINVAVYPMNVLLFAGGGAGGLANADTSRTFGGIGAGGHFYYGGGGGGGAGGLWYGNVTLNSGVTYTVTVGGGGAATNNTTVGGFGNNSTLTGSGFTTKTAYGGGGGGSSGTGSNGAGSTNRTLALANGSYACGGGGGGGTSNVSGALGTGTSGTPFPTGLGREGGTGQSNTGGGGGGGLLYPGANPTHTGTYPSDSQSGGYAGPGVWDSSLSSLIGATYTENLLTLTTTGSIYGGSSEYMLGNGGAGAPRLINTGYGGQFGGDAGTMTDNYGYFIGLYLGSDAIIDGRANMAGGGGGGVKLGGSGYAGNGGSGVIIISMPTTTYNLLTTKTNVASTVVNGDNTILKWNITGTFRIS